MSASTATPRLYVDVHLDLVGVGGVLAEGTVDLPELGVRIYRVRVCRRRADGVPFIALPALRRGTSWRPAVELSGVLLEAVESAVWAAFERAGGTR